MRTIDTIIENLVTNIKEGRILSPTWWAEAAVHLAVLRGSEDEKLAKRYIIAHRVIADLTEDNSATQAELKGKATQEYEDYLRQKYKVDQINEIINAAKLRARLAGEEYDQQG